MASPWWPHRFGHTRQGATIGAEGTYCAAPYAAVEGGSYARYLDILRSELTLTAGAACVAVPQ